MSTTIKENFMRSLRGHEITVILRRGEKRTGTLIDYDNQVIRLCSDNFSCSRSYDILIMWSDCSEIIPKVLNRDSRR